MFVVLLLVVHVCLAACAGEPNPPVWPSSVYVFSEAMSASGQTQSVVDAVFAQQGGSSPPFNGQWSSGRYAFFFLPGSHDNVAVPVGYYTSVVGLGVRPQDTQIGSVTVQNGDTDYSGGALSNFWRSAENFATTPSQYWNGGAAPSMLWAVSQACPLRRVLINGDLSLYQYNSGCCAGYASGGYVADAQVKGTVYSGSQQQFLLRNVQTGGWNGGNWNMVFVGCLGGPAAHCSNAGGWPISTVAATPLVAEKPYLVYDASTGRYAIAVPPLERDKTGATGAAALAATSYVDLSAVYVATATDSADVINAKLAAGLHLLLTPGVYNLTDAIVVSASDTLVLGVGFPTLVSTAGRPALVVAPAAVGVRVAGVLLQAGPANTTTLLQWGAAVGQPPAPGDASRPGFLYDCFARVGGTNDPAVEQVQADYMVTVGQGHVVVDNAWLWRADHGVTGEIYNMANPNYHALAVAADNVAAYGLACEHSLRTLTLWNGSNGTVYFYQSELPYDVTQQAFGAPGYNGFQVAAQADAFAGLGMGVYCYFRDDDVVVNSAITAGPSASFVNSLSVFLNGQGQINHVVNALGSPVNASAQTSYVCYA